MPGRSSGTRPASSAPTRPCDTSSERPATAPRAACAHPRATAASRQRRTAASSSRATRRALRGVAAAQLGAEAVADAVMRMHVGEARAAVELLAQLAHEDVDRAGAGAGGHVPDPLVQLVTAEHTPRVSRKLVEQAGLRARGARIGP